MSCHTQGSDDVPRTQLMSLEPLALVQAKLSSAEATIAPNILQAEPVLERPPNPKRVLVVDDDEWIRDLIARVLVRHHYAVSTASCAEYALEMLRLTTFDLLISDIILTGMSGLELSRRVLERRADLPVVLITALNEPDLMRDALRAGVSDFITKPFDIATIPLIVERNLERHALELKRSQEHDEVVMFMSVKLMANAIDAKETFTAQHSHRVAMLTEELALSLCLPTEETQYLKLASLVHDVGKIGIPDYILNKPGPLNAEEWLIMKQHPVRGAEIVGCVPQLFYVAEVVRHHHEWMNGNGYPDALCGEAIPRLSRMIAIADAYEVMTSDRVYRPRLCRGEAVQRLQAAAGTQFDSELTAAFVSLVADGLTTA